MNSAWAIATGLGGVFVGWLATYFNERVKWRRERVARWDERRQEQFIAFAKAVKLQAHLCNRMAASINLGRMDEPALDLAEGMPLLNQAEKQRAQAFEGVQLLADRRTIVAARDWQDAVLELRKVVSGMETTDPATYESLFKKAGRARDEFHLAARDSLSVGGEFVRSVQFERRV